MKNLLKKFMENPWGKTLAVIVTSYLIFAGVGFIFSLPVYILITKPISLLMPDMPNAARELSANFGPLRVFIAVTVVGLIVKRRTNGKIDMIAIFSPKRNGNTVVNLLIGLILGFVMNFICIMAAQAAGSFTLGFKNGRVLSIIIMFIGVFIQASSEELIFRGIMFEGIRKCHKSPLPAILITAFLFSANHGAVPGFFPIMMFFNFMAWGILYGLAVLYTDGIWMCFGLHTMWNYTQEYLCGLSNTGSVLPSSVFAPVSDPVYTNFYNSYIGATPIMDYGVENGILAPIVMGIAAIVFFFLYKKKMDAQK